MYKLCTALKAVVVSVSVMAAGTAVAEQLTVSVAAPDGSSVKGVVVFAEPLDKPAPASLKTPALRVAQEDKAFAPYVSVVQSNNAVKFVNNDDITHHVYSASGHNRFSFKIASGGSQEIIAGAGEANPFEVVAMGCNIHDWMSGYMLVLNTPYFAQTNAQGQVQLELAEKGAYQLNIWHPQLQTDGNLMQQSLNVQGDTALTVSLAKPLAPLPEQEGDDDFDFLEEY